MTSITKLSFVAHFLLYARRLSGVLLLGLLTACASTPLTQQLTSELPSVPVSTELDDVAFFPQQRYQCGPAALATMLSYQQVTITPEELVDQVYIPDRKGSLQIEMLATARHYGMVPYPLTHDLKTIVTEVAAGNPVLVFQNLAFSWYPQWHYAVVVGYDLNKQELILRSGTVRRHIISMATFERTWQRARFWAYVLTPSSNIPATASADTYLDAVHTLEQAGLEGQAYIAYRRAADNWPDNALIFMTLGNIEYQMQHYKNASKAFIRAITIENHNSSAWNNLAYALAARHCKNEAMRAVQCAVKLAPKDENIIASAREISTLSSGKHSCKIPQCP